MLKKTVSILLIFTMVITLAACSGSGTETVLKEPSSSNNSSSDTPSDTSSAPSSRPVDSTPSGGSLNDVKNPSSDASAQDSGLFSYPERYVVVYPTGSKELKEQAVRIQEYFSQHLRANIPVVADNSGASQWEILVGKTNRSQSSTMAENKYKVSIKDKKLVFDGGHFAMVELAVSKFIEKAPKSEAEMALSGTVKDFKSKMLGKYDYVWGDEFEGSEVDFTKWTFDEKMYGTSSIIVSFSRQTIDMKDGRLVLRALKSQNKDKNQYLVPTSVVSQYNMMYTYGYCEIKAKVPNATGVWPSFWTQSDDGIGERKCWDYFVEVDIFEVFGDPMGTFVPNLHKWYSSAAGGGHPVSDCKNKYTVPKSGSEYHTYGYEWTPSRISMYVDGNKYETYDITDANAFDNSGEMKGFRDPQFLIFNNHVFTPDSSFKPNLITNNEDALPAEYCIEYFRLYQKKGEGKIWINTSVHRNFGDR